MTTEESAEKLKGQAKEAVGRVTNDPDLQVEGENDQTAANTKEKIGDVADKASGAVDSVKDKLNDKNDD